MSTGLPQNFPEPIQQKLIAILKQKSKRAGELALPFLPESFPLNTRVLFPGYQKYVLELGSGWGEFTRKMAQREPANFFLAVEKKLDRILTSTRKQKQEQITNIRYLLLDIAWFFEGVFAPQQFDRVVINFPDPWPKARHHKHRFFSTALAEILANITTPGAVLEFATDDYAYMREAMQVLEKHPQWHNRVAPWHASGSIPNRPQSYFETLHRAEGAPIYFLVYGRAAH